MLWHRDTGGWEMALALNHLLIRVRGRNLRVTVLIACVAMSKAIFAAMANLVGHARQHVPAIHVAPYLRFAVADGKAG